MELGTKLKVYVITAAFAIGCASVVCVILRHKRKYRDASDALSYMNIKIVVNENVCDEVVGEIRRVAYLKGDNLTLLLKAVTDDRIWCGQNMGLVPTLLFATDDRTLQVVLGVQLSIDVMPPVLSKHAEIAIAIEATMLPPNCLRKKRKERSVGHHAVGFDCEWVTTNGKRRAVALLQLSTLDGYCGLFRLNQMKTVPDSLKSLLEDNTICKVGVAPTDDAKYLFQDYSAILKNSLDLRHLARLNGYNAGGLAALSQSLLRIVLDKNWKVRCSDWEVKQLTSSQVMYAAADAHIAIKIFAKLINECRNKGSTFGWFNVINKELYSQYLDVAFKVKHDRHQNDNIKNGNNSNTENPLVSKRYPHAVRSKPLYHNCFLQAPDGELLCTCDTKKAHWYTAKGLARVVQQEPLTVRLRFEPAGRSVGAVGRYYQLAKENKCVVCGSTDSYIRKNVVPREYRKYFPEVMKDHSSHDVVLLCARCHQRSNVLDLAVREALAATCAAPLARAPRPLADDPHKSVRSAARALLYQAQKHALPAARRAELEAALRDHFAPAPLSRHLLEEAARAPAPTTNTDEDSHGMKVVEYFLKHDGLLRLEEYWREHFLDSMEPKYMPELWSTKHNEERLRVRFDEGRLSDKDLHLIGLTKWV